MHYPLALIVTSQQGKDNDKAVVIHVTGTPTPQGSGSNPKPLLELGDYILPEGWAIAGARRSLAPPPLLLIPPAPDIVLH